jgi:hypothetical protein
LGPTLAALRVRNECLEKHPEIQDGPHGLARIYGQIAFVYTALDSKQASKKRLISEALSMNVVEVRAYLSLLVISRVVKASTILRRLNFLGRSI